MRVSLEYPRILAWLIFLTLSRPGVLAESPSPNRNRTMPVLEGSSWDSWKTKIETDEAETNFLKIPWRIRFLTAMQEAQRLEKPVMLFVMNGHPLGCT
jgi:hypothetical protein